MKELPRRKEYYSLSAQATRDEVIGAYKSYFALKINGNEKARPPGFRKRNSYSNLRYYDGFGFEVIGTKIKLRFGRSRLDGVKEVEVEMQGRDDVQYTKVRNVVITYDKKFGLQAHLVVDVEDQSHLAIEWLLSTWVKHKSSLPCLMMAQRFCIVGRKSRQFVDIWNKVRRMVKPPIEGQRKSRR